MAEFKEVDWEKPMIIGGKHPMFYLYAISMRGDHVDDLELRWLSKHEGNALILIRRLKPMGWEQKTKMEKIEEKIDNILRVVNTTIIGKIPPMRGNV